jgi:hypothetical protein
MFDPNLVQNDFFYEGVYGYGVTLYRSIIVILILQEQTWWSPTPSQLQTLQLARTKWYCFLLICFKKIQIILLYVDIYSPGVVLKNKILHSCLEQVYKQQTQPNLLHTLVDSPDAMLTRFDFVTPVRWIITSARPRARRPTAPPRQTSETDRRYSVSALTRPFFCCPLPT